MRIIVTARQTLTPGYEQILNRLVTILGVISKNPSNPHFDQYIFESISGLMRCDRRSFVHRFLSLGTIRFIVASSPSALQTFENTLLGPFVIILEQDIDRMSPHFPASWNSAHISI